jgi:hypothetical protein
MKVKHMQMIGLALFILVICMWFLVSKVSKYEQDAAETEISKLMAKKS